MGSATKLPEAIKARQAAERAVVRAVQGLPDAEAIRVLRAVLDALLPAPSGTGAAPTIHVSDPCDRFGNFGGNHDGRPPEFVDPRKP